MRLSRTLGCGSAVVVALLFFSAAGLNEQGAPPAPAAPAAALPSASSTADTSEADRCFRELHGVVEDCRCSVDVVDRMNNHIFGFASDLLQLDYFKFYKSNFNASCPFWSDDGECRSKSCAVSVCTDSDIPLGLKTDEEAGRVLDCGVDGGTDLADVLHTISDAQLQAIESWHAHDDGLDGFCDVDDDSYNGVFVNLLDNPERFTGYIGSSPGRIWRAIYSENCFKPDNFVGGFLTQKMIRDLCMEKRVFYRIMSGLHACINLHVAASYPSSPGGFPPRPTVWGPNVTMFDIFFDPQRTFGEGPSRLHNMYFTYLLLLRAVVKGAPLWTAARMHSGSAAQDAEAESLIASMVAATSDCGATFDETLMFKNSDGLKAEFSAHFKNVSRIMDCVGCEKCRLWGKLQVTGIGAAMKILFSQPGLSLAPRLRRNEIVALFVTFGRFSQALNELQHFRHLKQATQRT